MWKCEKFSNINRFRNLVHGWRIIGGTHTRHSWASLRMRRWGICPSDFPPLIPIQLSSSFKKHHHRPRQHRNALKWMDRHCWKDPTYSAYNHTLFHSSCWVMRSLATITTPPKAPADSIHMVKHCPQGGKCLISNEMKKVQIGSRLSAGVTPLWNVVVVLAVFKTTFSETPVSHLFVTFGNPWQFLATAFFGN